MKLTSRSGRGNGRKPRTCHRTCHCASKTGLSSVGRRQLQPRFNVGKCAYICAVLLRCRLWCSRVGRLRWFLWLGLCRPLSTSPLLEAIVLSPSPLLWHELMLEMFLVSFPCIFRVSPGVPERIRNSARQSVCNTRLFEELPETVVGNAELSTVCAVAVDVGRMSLRCKSVLSCG